VTTARLIEGGARPAVRLERVLAHDPATVWSSLTEADQLKAWFPCTAEPVGGQWEVGAALTFRFPDDVGAMVIEGRVLIADAPRLLSYSWGEDVLTFELQPEGTGTRLVLTDELPPSWAARNAAGWELCLDRLAGLVPGEDAWRPRFELYSARFEPAIGAQEGPPSGAGD